jgi:hypothetical protein
MAPIPRQTRRDRRRMPAPSMPPSAATGTPASRASRFQRSGPRTVAPGWLAVAKIGERNTRSAPALRARRSSIGPWAELLTSPRRGRTGPGQNPLRRWTPAPSAAASRASPATTRARRRARQMRARSRPSARRPGSPSCRSTTPARPRGSRATAGRGSGSRRASVNSHIVGRRRRGPFRLAAAARAQATSRASMPAESRGSRHGRA